MIDGFLSIELRSTAFTNGVPIACTLTGWLSSRLGAVAGALRNGLAASTGRARPWIRRSLEPRRVAPALGSGEAWSDVPREPSNASGIRAQAGDPFNETPLAAGTKP